MPLVLPSRGTLVRILFLLECLIAPVHTEAFPSPTKKDVVRGAKMHSKRSIRVKELEKKTKLSLQRKEE